MISLAQQLCGKLALSDLAAALQLPVQHVRDFALELERSRRRSEALDPAWARKWCEAAREAADQLAAGTEPHFGDVCHLRGSLRDRLAIQLLQEDGAVAAQWAEELSKVRTVGGELRGPFEMSAPDGKSHCLLHGSVRLRGIELPTRTGDLGVLCIGF